jgi:1,5-anhydro-D-fructose reductase (1,5-anhydro-D-mannitol-forming)
VNWAYVGASTIAGQHLVGAVRAQAGSKGAWVVRGSADRVADFARAHGLGRSGTDMAAAFAEPSVDAVYISSTNVKHHAQVMSTIAAGKSAPAPSGNDGVKSQQIAKAVRCDALTGQRQTVNHGETR